MSAPASERRGGLSKASSGDTPHVILLRMVKRLWLVIGQRPANTEPGLNWPALIEKQMASKERLPSDDFSTVMTISERRSEPLYDNQGRPQFDRDGVQRRAWVEGPREVPDEPCNYGGLVRMLAKKIGLAPKSLSKWSEAEVMRIAWECVRTLDMQKGAEAMRRADEFLFYPSGWREAYQSTKAHARDAGWAKDESE